jgi:Golgi nucleoside diphosphatase
MKILLLFVLPLLPVFQADLEKRKLLDDKVEILVPKNFKQMGPEMLDFKYKGKNRPTLVFTDDAAAVNLAFNLLPNQASEDLIETYKNSVKASFQASFPNAIWKGDGVRIINGRKVGYLKLITEAIDQPIYNYLFITHCQGKLLVGTFNCTERRLPEWEENAEKIVESLKVQ